MKNRVFIIALIVMGVVAFITYRYSDDVTGSTFSDKLKAEGFDAELRLEGKTFITSINSESELLEICPEDILTMHRVRNEARVYAQNNKNKDEPKSIATIITNAKGEVIYDTLINDAFVIQPEYAAITNSTKNVKDNVIVAMLNETFKENSIDIIISSFSKSLLGGNFIEFELINHANKYDDINRLIPKIQTLVESLNVNGAQITEYILFVNDENNNNDLLLILTVDLLYRDYLWWQSEKFNYQTWTNSGPAPEADVVNGEVNKFPINAQKTPAQAANGN